ncbi:hypothetical protein [Desulfomicrobium norvegicum]|uniref:hypothetical protein n=1 Tax=Desulfomicrobium norvegicum (strain DSM 1741 / NCIMB 8310) TaxID=52561 RepID=UPI0011602D87|nr:hypothetical protein [Desulfomicrobium norvegicum]
MAAIEAVPSDQRTVLTFFLMHYRIMAKLEDVKQQEENGGPPDFRGHGSVEQGRCVHDDSRGPHLRFVDQPEI